MELTLSDASYTTANFKTWTPGKPFESGKLVSWISADGQDLYKGLKIEFITTRDVGSPGRTPVGIRNYWVAAIPALSPIRVSPDGRYLSVISSDFLERANSGQVFVWDLISRKPRVESIPTPKAFSPEMVWSPDSKYLGYFAGAIMPGGGPNVTIGYRFVAYNVQAKTDADVKQSPGFDYSWAGRNELLSSFDEERSTSSPEEDSENPAAYKINFNAAFPRLLFRNATGPLAESPDRNWVAFSGWPDKDMEQADIASLLKPGANTAGTGTAKAEKTYRDVAEMPYHGAGMYLYDYKQKRRRLIASAASLGGTGFDYARVSQLTWSPDSKFVIFCFLDNIYSYEVSSRQLRKLGLIKEPEVDPGNTSNIDRLVEFLGFSADGQYLIIQNGWSRYLQAVQAVSLQDGSLSTLTNISGAHNVCWVIDKPAAH